MAKKQSLIVVVGPTASGKSDLAIRLAKKINGEIISADSRQIYRDLTIGTAKVAGIWQHMPAIPAKAGNQHKKSEKIYLKKKYFFYKNIPHYCIDSVSPKKVYSAADFKQCGISAITDIIARKKIPIIAGGTGLWVDTLAYDLDLPHVPPNAALRKQLEKKSTAELFVKLKKIDPRRAATIEQKNPRRLIRALEIALTLGRVPLLRKRNLYRTLWIGIARDPAEHDRAIARRAHAMIRRGLIAETTKLLQKGVSKKRIREFGFEYSATLDAIEKKITKTQLKDILIQETRAYVKRQIRWFQRNHEIHWIRTPDEAQKLAKKFLRTCMFDSSPNIGEVRRGNLKNAKCKYQKSK